MARKYNTLFNDSMLSLSPNAADARWCCCTTPGVAVAWDA